MTETFTNKDNSQKSVVLLEYPRKGIWAVGFATKENQGLMRTCLMYLFQQHQILQVAFYLWCQKKI